MYRNNRGQATIFMIFIILILFVALMIIFIGGVTTIKVNDALNQNISLGQVNLKTMNENTFGKFPDMYLNNADWWGISIIFGLILGLFISAYFTRNTLPKWWLILDIFIILAIFITSLYVSSAYKDVLNELSDAGNNLDFLETNLPKSSTFMSNLPIFVVIIGVITMILFHSSMPRKNEETYQSGGYLQGAY